jgi:UDP-N-acetylmuramyl pentapeptide phosphotransferase/UDP-N-acetylglucosamine-1-phosphate transferase
VELLYFKIARKYAIVDKPNHRSSHKSITIRGGGIIFPLASFTALFVNVFEGWQLFSIALLLISLISFIDDIVGLSSYTRLYVQLVSLLGIVLIFYNHFPWYVLFLMTLIMLLVVNVYNFMDGINGITVLYSILSILSLFWVNKEFAGNMPNSFYISISMSLVVFAIFNVRKRALAFAGDVGSVSIALIISFLLLKLMIDTKFIWWICFIGIYFIDAFATIFLRIIRGESVIKAHRSHFYQYLANEVGWSHIQVSILYFIAQTLLNLVVVYAYITHMEWVLFITLLVFLTIYIIFRLRLEGYKRLFVTYNLD